MKNGAQPGRESGRLLSWWAGGFVFAVFKTEA